MNFDLSILILTCYWITIEWILILNFINLLIKTTSKIVKRKNLGKCKKEKEKDEFSRYNKKCIHVLHNSLIINYFNFQKNIFLNW